jgi:hypothetical protein
MPYHAASFVIIASSRMWSHKKIKLMIKRMVMRETRNFNDGDIFSFMAGIIA